MEFGEWMRKARAERHIDLRRFAQAIGVDPGTVSRIENEHTQARVLTAFKCCSVLEYPFSTLYTDLSGESFVEPHEHAHTDDILTCTEIEARLQAYEGHPAREQGFLVEEMARLLKQLMPEYEPYTFYPQDIHKFLCSNPLYQPITLNYPPLAPEHIRTIMSKSGAILEQDVMHYRSYLPKRFALSPTQASLERIRVHDILTIDTQTNQHGTLFALYWQTCNLYEKYAHQEEWKMRLATLVILLNRWNIYLRAQKEGKGHEHASMGI